MINYQRRILTHAAVHPTAKISSMLGSQPAQVRRAPLPNSTSAA